MTRGIPRSIESAQKRRLAGWRARGYLLVETLIVSLITALVSTAMLLTITMNSKVQMKTGNYVDAVIAARTAIDRIGIDVRTGRSFGDVFGVEMTDAFGDTYVVGSSSFPSANDPIYGNGQSPAGGSWPSSWGGSPSVGSPWTVSNTMLIVQVPVYDLNEWPTEIPVGQGSPAVTSTMGPQANVETHFYNVVPDSTNPGTYLLQYFAAPGYPTTGSGYVPDSHCVGPVTLLSGIVGPTDSSGNLKIFQYLAKKGSIDDTSPSGQPQNTVNSTTIANYTGVIVNLEILKQNEGKTQPVHLAFKQEVFIRNNALATATGDPN